MNHSFTATITPNKCGICGRDKLSHTALAQCESCTQIGPCNVVGTILMCATCEARDKEIQAELNPTPDSKQARIARLANSSAKTIAEDRKLYFVKRITAIVDIEKELNVIIDGPAEDEEKNLDAKHELAKIIENNLTLMKERLAKKHQEIREMQGEAIADQVYLNQIVPQLRIEEREKFKAYDITYKPPVVTPTATASKPRMSATDRAYESMAKSFGMTVEQYKLHLEKVAANVLSIKCTCAETPGTCKVHNP